MSNNSSSQNLECLCLSGDITYLLHIIRYSIILKAHFKILDQSLCSPDVLHQFISSNIVTEMHGGGGKKDHHGQLKMRAQPSPNIETVLRALSIPLFLVKYRLDV